MFFSCFFQIMVRIKRCSRGVHTVTRQVTKRYMSNRLTLYEVSLEHIKTKSYLINQTNETNSRCFHAWFKVSLSHKASTLKSNKTPHFCQCAMFIARELILQLATHNEMQRFHIFIWTLCSPIFMFVRLRELLKSSVLTKIET